MRQNRLESDDLLAGALESLRDVPPPNVERQEASLQEFLSHARTLRHEMAVSPDRAMRHRERRGNPLRLNMGYALRRFSMVAAIVVVLVAALATGGVVYASDSAGPGDALYGVDMAVEQARLGLTGNPENAVRLQIGFADERLEEATNLADEGDFAHTEEALRNYGDTIASLTATMETAGVGDDDEVNALLEMALNRHQAQLGYTFQNMEQASVGGEPGGDFCVGAEPHPVAETLAELYPDVAYDDIMAWFCEGNYGFGEILLALQASEESGIAVPEILTMRSELDGWGQVWREIGLTGRGRPAHTGQPEEPGQQSNPGQGNQGNPGQGNQGNPGQGNPGQGNPGQGTQGNPGQGNQGNPGQGNQGNPGQGNPGQGNPGQGNQGNPGQGNQGEGDDVPDECLAGLTEETEAALAALAETYEVEYEDVLALYCEGTTLEEIESALINTPLPECDQEQTREQDRDQDQDQTQDQISGGQNGGQGNRP